MALSSTRLEDSEQSEGTESEFEIDDGFQDSNNRVRLQTRMSMGRCNFLNLSTRQKFLIAILLTISGICIGVYVSKSTKLEPAEKTAVCLSNECANGINEYSRACADGYEGQDCKYHENQNASLIISSHENIRMISLLGGLNTTQMIQNEDNVEGTDFNFRTNTLIWFSYNNKTIYEAPIEPEGGKQILIEDFTSDILSLAVDWIHNHLYWVDYSRKQLCVSLLSGTMTKVLFNEGLLNPTSIAVNPLNGWMYWTDSDTDRIERAGMDGSRREVMLSTLSESPYSIVVDFTYNRLYWSQGFNPCSIWTSDFHGFDRKLILTANPPQFHSSYFWKISAFRKHVYFIDYWSKTIYNVNKRNGTQSAMIYQSESYLYNIKIHDAAMQPDGENLCSKRIGPCSHFCFPVPSPGNGTVSTTTCACPDGLSLSADELNCV